MVHALQHTDAGVQEGTLSMVYKIAEDFPFQLQADVNFAPDAVAKPADVLMPHIASLFSSSKSGDVRYHALRTFNKLVDLMPEWLLNNMDGYVTGLLALANSESDARIHRVCFPSVTHFLYPLQFIRVAMRSLFPTYLPLPMLISCGGKFTVISRLSMSGIMQEVCVGTNTLMRERSQALEPHLDAFIMYILAAMQHSEHEVAIEATMFWILYLENGLPIAHLAPRLPKVVEVLLRHMVFEEHDEEVVAAQEAEHGATKDSDNELRPFHSARGSGGSSGTPYTDTEDGSRSGQGDSLPYAGPCLIIHACVATCVQEVILLSRQIWIATTATNTLAAREDCTTVCTAPDSCMQAARTLQQSSRCAAHVPRHWTM